jgi:N-methylhydantoinase A/oxoprolinase/acetone carboxylase beta subunit
MRIGVDVGGTNTDAVLMSGDRVLATNKSPTTADVSGGITSAIRSVLATAGCAPRELAAVMIGTTHFTNAFVERRRLTRIGVIRIGYPATTAIPPLYGWPAELLKQVGSESRIVAGGYEFDGTQIAPFDESAVGSTARRFRKAGLRSIAISAVFAPLNRQQEERAADIVRNEHPEAVVSLSSDFGRLGLLERENAAAMNAALADLASHVVASFAQALRELQIGAPFFISQNDGTLMTAEYAALHPVMTFASGPTNSMRGAALLARAQNALVIDIGGTTTDIGVLQHGFPRESSMNAGIGGVRTNFRMPDIVSVGLGGGSIVSPDGAVVGPQSLGYRIIEDALVFGGSVLTATDIVVAAGLAEVGDRRKVSHLDARTVERALESMRAMVERGVERIKLNASEVPVILVGGGSILINGQLRGASQVIVPPHHAVANAVGAAIAQAGGEVDRYYSYDQLGRDAALEDAKAAAVQSAVAAGAVAKTVIIVDVQEYPIAYLGGGMTRVRIKAVGEMHFGSAGTGAGTGAVAGAAFGVDGGRDR